MKTRKGSLKRSIETSESEESDSSDDYYEDCISKIKSPYRLEIMLKLRMDYLEYFMSSL